MIMCGPRRPAPAAVLLLLLVAGSAVHGGAPATPAPAAPATPAPAAAPACSTITSDRNACEAVDKCRWYLANCIPIDCPSFTEAQCVGVTWACKWEAGGVAPATPAPPAPVSTPAPATPAPAVTPAPAATPAPNVTSAPTATPAPAGGGGMLPPSGGGGGYCRDLATPPPAPPAVKCFVGSSRFDCLADPDCSWQDEAYMCYATADGEPDPCSNNTDPRPCRYNTQKSAHRCYWDSGRCRSDVNCVPGTTEGRCLDLWGCSWNEQACIKTEDIKEPEESDDTVMWIIIIVVLVLCCLVAIGYLLWRRRKEREAEEERLARLEEDNIAMREKQEELEEEVKKKDVTLIEHDTEADDKLQKLTEELKEEKAITREQQEKLDNLDSVMQLKQEAAEQDEILRQDELLAAMAPVWDGSGVSPHAEGAHRPKAGQDAAFFAGVRGGSPKSHKMYRRTFGELSAGGAASPHGSPFAGKARQANAETLVQLKALGRRPAKSDVPGADGGGGDAGSAAALPSAGAGSPRGPGRGGGAASPIAPPSRGGGRTTSARGGSVPPLDVDPSPPSPLSPLDKVSVRSAQQVAV